MAKAMKATKAKVAEQPELPEQDPAAAAGCAQAQTDPVPGRWLKLPMIRSTSYALSSIDVTLRGCEAEALRDLTSGLRAQGAVLKDGQKVTEPRHAIRWILERLAQA